MKRFCRSWKRLISVTDKKTTAYTVSVPPYRVDNPGSRYLEEILRIYGLNIELSEFVGFWLYCRVPEKDINRIKAYQMLVANGFKIWTNSLTNAAYQKNNPTFTGEAIETLNKLSEKQGFCVKQCFYGPRGVCAQYQPQAEENPGSCSSLRWSISKQTESTSKKSVWRFVRYQNIETENWQSKTRSTTYYDLAQQCNAGDPKSGISKYQTGGGEGSVIWVRLPTVGRQ